jgi:hypothetical protein
LSTFNDATITAIIDKRTNKVYKPSMATLIHLGAEDVQLVNADKEAIIEENIRSGKLSTYMKNMVEEGIVNRLQLHQKGG